jgi:hypothetical protein
MKPLKDLEQHTGQNGFNLGDEIRWNEGTVPPAAAPRTRSAGGQ